MTDLSTHPAHQIQAGDRDDHRDSIEQLRAVGQTFVDGLSALRDRVSATPVTDATSESGVHGGPSSNANAADTFNTPPHAVADLVPRGPDRSQQKHGQTSNSKEVPVQESLRASVPPPRSLSGQVATPEASMSSSPPRSPRELQRDVDRLQNILFATERKLEARIEECADLRATTARLASRHEREQRQLETLRGEIKSVGDAADVERGRAERAVAEAARLRTELVDVERELGRQTSETDELRRTLLAQKQKNAALERVVIGLRRRVAMADAHVEAAKRVESAVAAQHAAESALVEARTQLERFRARAAAVDSLRDRTAAVERNGHELRDKIASLEREIESKDAVVRQGMAERRKLNEFMGRYEKQLEEKEAQINGLRQQLRQAQASGADVLGSQFDDGGENTELVLSESSSALSSAWVNDVRRNMRRARSERSVDSTVSHRSSTFQVSYFYAEHSKVLTHDERCDLRFLW